MTKNIPVSMVCCNTEVQCKLQADLADVTLNQDQEANDVNDQKPPGGDEIPKAVQEGENEEEKVVSTDRKYGEDF